MSSAVVKVKLVAQSTRRDRETFLPVSIIDAQGRVVGKGVVSSSDPCWIRYSYTEEQLFVRLNKPGGVDDIRPLINAEGRPGDEIIFALDGDNQRGWSGLRPGLREDKSKLMRLPGMENAWLQIWERSRGARDVHHYRDAPPAFAHPSYVNPQISVRPSSGWRQRDVPSGIALTETSFELALENSHHSRALVVRLDSDISHVYSLPMSRARVLISPARSLSGAVSPTVVIQHGNRNAESIMDFLLAGRFGSLASMLDPGRQSAYWLLQDKFFDPLAATAAAYYLLRKKDWEMLPPHWLYNLSCYCREIPDTALILAASMIQRGMPMAEARQLAANALSTFFDEGLPLFAEARTLLADLLALAVLAKIPPGPAIIKKIQMMLSYPVDSGVNFAFPGTAPNKPIPAKIVNDIKILEGESEDKRGDVLYAEVTQLKERFALREKTGSRFSKTLFLKDLM